MSEATVWQDDHGLWWAEADGITTHSSKEAWAREALTSLLEEQDHD